MFFPSDVLRGWSSRASLCSSDRGFSGGLADGSGLELVHGCVASEAVALDDLEVALDQSHVSYDTIPSLVPLDVIFSRCEPLFHFLYVEKEPS